MKKCFLSLLVCVHFLCLQNLFSQNVTADFSTSSDLPLVKKFDFMNSGLVGLSRYQRDLNKLIDTRAKAMRLDLFWGNTGNGWAQEMVQGTADSLVYYYKEIDALSQLLKNQNMAGYWSYCYVPIPLQTGGYITYDSLLAANWQGIMFNFASHFKKNKLRPEYQGIWNEPDFAILQGTKWVPQFFNGSQGEYNYIYKIGVKGLRQGDPDATVGGPDLTGSNNGWPASFLNYVKNNKLPIDFYSFHMLANDYPSVNARANELIQRGSFFNQTEMMIGELNPMCCNSSSYDGAIGVLNSINFYIEKPYFTRTFWAQGMDVGSGDNIGALDYYGHKRALYYAYKFYAMMPVDRKQLNITASVNGLASSDVHHSSVLLWNTSGSQQTVNIALNNIPFAKGTMKVNRIDATHNSYNDTPSSEDIAPDVTNNVSTSGLTWSGSIPDKAVVFIDITDSTGISEDASIFFPASFVRKHYYFPDRSKNNYAEFDRTTWIARLGMSNYDTASSIIGVVAEDLPDSINVIGEMEGNPTQIDNNSILGIRLDYRISDSIYSGSVLFHGGIYNAGRNAICPFGTKQQADKIVQVDLNNFVLVPSQYAPTNWNGKVLITYVMENTGKNSRAKFKLRPVNKIYPFKIHSIPCTVEAEDFDNGGYGNAYSISDTSIFSNASRTDEKIKIENCSDTLGGFDITQLKAGDWVKYTIYNPKKDIYSVSARVATLLDSSMFHIEIGNNIKSKNFNIDSTMHPAWMTVYDTLSIDSGTYVMKLVIDKGNIKINNIIFNKIIRPYNGIIQVPGIIQAENFDVNGYTGVGIGDNTGTYRPNENVDVLCSKNICAVRWTESGESLQYTVHAYRAGKFQMQAYVASNSLRKMFEVDIDGVKMMDTIVPNKYSFDVYTAVTKKIQLDTGMHIVTISTTTGNFNLDKLVIDTVSLGIKEYNNLSNNISIYPNPAKTNLTIDFSKYNDDMPCYLTLVDITGRIVYQENISDKKKYEMNLERFDNGMYFVMIRTSNSEYATKLFIQK